MPTIWGLEEAYLGGQMNDAPEGLHVPLVHYGAMYSLAENMLQTRLTCTACEAGGGRRSRPGLWLEGNRVNSTPSFNSVLQYW